MRKTLFFIFLFVFGLVFSAQAQLMPYRLAVFGDSLSAGYNLPPQDAFYSQLERALHDKGYPEVTVIHISKSGETSAGGLARIHEVLKADPDAVLLELGVNDAIRNVPIASIHSNLEKIIDTLLQDGRAILLAGMQAPPTGSRGYQKDFSVLYAKLAKKYKLTLYPFFMKGLFNKRDLLSPSPYLQADMVHPTKEGVALIVKNILPTVEKFLKQQGLKPRK